MIATSATIAWVLIFGFGYNWGYAIPGIKSEAACHALAQKIDSNYLFQTPRHYCFSYELAEPRP